MKKQRFICYIITLMFLVSACSSEDNDKVKIYEMLSFTETKVDSMKEITDSADVNILLTAFKSASENMGIADMEVPHYKVDFGNRAYFLWINEDSGIIMDVENTHITYSLSESSIQNINKIINSHYEK